MMSWNSQADPNEFLGGCSVIDLDHPDVRALAERLRFEVSPAGAESGRENGIRMPGIAPAGSGAQVDEIASRSQGAWDPLAVARRCFEFVRDRVRHSSDHRLNPVTLTASETLRHGTGFCYAKSHLLCALLRANGIPAGLCYQRLTIQADHPPFCLHGLNAVHLPGLGWVRVDARGNRDDIDVQFDPPHESLAFQPVTRGECDLPGLFAEPLPEVVKCLTKHSTWDQVLADLPDVDSQAEVDDPSDPSR